MAREDPHFRLRIPQDLLEKVQAAAAEVKRSATAEIVSRLEQSFEWEKLVQDYQRAEIRLVEQEKTERELRRQIEIIETNLADMKAGRDVDLTNEAVQQAMIDRMREVMGSVVEDMREEQRITSGMPLLLAWFDQHPEERVMYDALPEGDQDVFVVQKAQELWLHHINDRRAADGKRPAVAPKPGGKVRLEK